MAVNKNFVVKNGLEVNTKLILADATTQKVGIGSTAPKFELEVAGGIGATSIVVTGVSTLASQGGITTTGGDFYVGGTLYGVDRLTLENVVVSGASTLGGLVKGAGGLEAVVIGTGLSVTGITTLAGAGGILLQVGIFMLVETFM